MGHPQRHFSVDQQCLIPQDPAGLITSHLRVIKSAPRGFYSIDGARSFNLGFYYCLYVWTDYGGSIHSGEIP